MVVAIEESKELSQISVDELVGSLQAHEHKMKQNDDTRNLDQVLQSKLSFNESGARDNFGQGTSNHGGYRGGYRGRNRGGRGTRRRGNQSYGKAQTSKEYQTSSHGQGFKRLENVFGAKQYQARPDVRDGHMMAGCGRVSHTG
ncbi:hypothetical protein J1N35_015259 [Gossypium stocksii]|uniref:Uncharacterized protein n=1 Tax=Gossypium stocksii TaxID=47602 RepID=A0A9D3VWW8_9ROSI|nr:hypothetical protein J1N35_015259 [Gossypium stocksii]